MEQGKKRNGYGQQEERGYGEEIEINWWEKQASEHRILSKIQCSQRRFCFLLKDIFTSVFRTCTAYLHSKKSNFSTQ